MPEGCIKCGNTNFLTLESHLLIECEYVARIKAYWNGKINAYCDNVCKDFYDNFPAFSFEPFTHIDCDNDIFDFTICLECGWIVGLDLDQLKKNVQKVFDPKYLDKINKVNSSNSSNYSNSSSSSMDDLEKLKMEVEKAKLMSDKSNSCEKSDKLVDHNKSVRYDEFDYIKYTHPEVIPVESISNTTIGNLVDELVNRKIKCIPKNIKDLSQIF